MVDHDSSYSPQRAGHCTGHYQPFRSFRAFRHKCSRVAPTHPEHTKPQEQSGVIITTFHRPAIALASLLDPSDPDMQPFTFKISSILSPLRGGPDHTSRTLFHCLYDRGLPSLELRYDCSILRLMNDWRSVHELHGRVFAIGGNYYELVGS